MMESRRKITEPSCCGVNGQQFKLETHGNFVSWGTHEERYLTVTFSAIRMRSPCYHRHSLGEKPLNINVLTDVRTVAWLALSACGCKVFSLTPDVFFRFINTGRTFFDNSGNCQFPLL